MRAQPLSIYRGLDSAVRENLFAKIVKPCHLDQGEWTKAIDTRGGGKEEFIGDDFIC